MIQVAIAKSDIDYGKQLHSILKKLDEKDTIRVLSYAQGILAVTVSNSLNQVRLEAVIH